MSPSWHYAVRHIAAGLCAHCSVPAVPGRKRCAKHLQKDRDRKRARWIPRPVSVITLEITAVRVEQVQDISEQDARAEGAVYHDGGGIGHSGWRHDPKAEYVYATAKASFAALWDSINGKTHPWVSNPWVWVIEFKQVSA